VCFWEDDPEQAERPWSRGGANGQSLVEAQQAFLRHGAVDTEFISKVRQPRAEEVLQADWRPYDPADGGIDSALED
jgi:Cysteine-rich CPCC